MIELPTSPVKGDNTKINSMLIISRPKVGKTSALMQIPNSILIDLQRSSRFYTGIAYDVLTEGDKLGKGPINMMFALAKTIKEANHKAGGYVYKVGIIDPITELEKYCIPYATSLYKKTAQGQNFEGKDVVAELEYGAGYLWLRNAFDSVLHAFKGLFETLVLVGHVKDSSINMKGKSIGVTDIDLTGKLKNIVAGDCDAIATMYRDPEDENRNILSFITSSTDVITGARPLHLSGNEFDISIIDPNAKELTTFWDQIFPNLFS